MLEKFLTPRETAERLGITRQAVHKMIREGRIHFEKIGRQYFIPKQEAERVAAKNSR